MKSYELVESPSELRLRVSGATIEALFRHALLAMFEVVEPRYCEKSQEFSHTITISSADRDALLIDFLSHALYLSDINNEAFHGVTFSKLTDHSLQAVVFGKKINGFAIEIKAVTHHGANILQHGRCAYTELTFDI